MYLKKIDEDMINNLLKYNGLEDIFL